MAKLLKLRRGTTSQHSSFTGAEGELTVDTTKDTAVVHDGSTAGGRPLLREDLDNMPASGVSAGTYGSSSAIPSITVDAKGRVTGATTTSIDSTAITNGTSNVSVANNGDVTVARAGTTTLTVDSAGTIMPDGKKARFGAAGDLQIFHDGSNSIIDDAGTGNLILNGNEVRILSNDNSENAAKFITNGAVELFYDGSKKLNTRAAGVLVTGELECDSLDVDGAADISGNLAVGGTVDGRDVASDGSKLDGIESGATADQTAAEILAAIKTVDGSGSGLDADQLDGQTGAFYRNASNLNAGTIPAARLPVINSVPSGVIFIWSGSVANIPTGYVLCNGSNSTPDLRNRFVVGAGTGSNYTLEDTGGANTMTLGVSNLPSHSHSTGSHAHSIGNHSHTVSNHSHSTPNHSHGVNSHSHSTPNHNHNMNNHSHSTNNTGGHSHNMNFRNRENNTQYPDRIDVAKTAARNSSFNQGTSNAGSHSHNTNSSKSNTNASGGGNTGSNAPNTTSSGASNTGNSAPNTSSAALGDTGSASAGTTGNTGSGAATENRPPFFALCYIMKT